MAEHIIQMIEKRSGVARLTLTLQQSITSPPYGSQVCVESIFRLLHRTHCLDLVLYWPSDDSSVPLFPITRDKYPRLQHLTALNFNKNPLPCLGFVGVESFDLYSLPCYNLDPTRSFFGGTANLEIINYRTRRVPDAILEACLNLTRLPDLWIWSDQWVASSKLSSCNLERLALGAFFWSFTSSRSR